MGVGAGRKGQWCRRAHGGGQRGGQHTGASALSRAPAGGRPELHWGCGLSLEAPRVWPLSLKPLWHCRHGHAPASGPRATGPSRLISASLALPPALSQEPWPELSCRPMARPSRRGTQQMGCRVRGCGPTRGEAGAPRAERALGCLVAHVDPGPAPTSVGLRREQATAESWPRHLRGSGPRRPRPRGASVPVGDPRGR